jgi:Ca-activated chloride channel family protein
LLTEIRDLQQLGKPTEMQMKELRRRIARSADPEAVRLSIAKAERQAQIDGKQRLGPRDGEAIAANETDSLMMAVTPRIIIQEEQEEHFGIVPQTDGGLGPGSSGDKYVPIVENPFIKTVGPDAVSTFSIDVDTASYTNVRQFLTQMNQLPPPDAVRIEELVNYFQYDYTPPKTDDETPFAAHMEVAGCPWNVEHRLARIAVKGREMDREKRPKSNLVFLVDVSGSMDEPAKLPLVIYGLERLTKELGENDRIAIVVYASSEGLVLPSTNGMKQDEILGALGKLSAGGSTAGGAGIQLAYQIAEDNFIKGGTNRVILCTDGDFNVGVTSTAELQRLVEKKAKDTGVFLSVLGFGRGNLNDAMMEAIADHGNGNYHYVDNRTEARKVLVEEMAGTLVTIAKDVKIQVEFNPAQVAAYRLIGYENRMLRTEDFNNDKKDAGEIGAGHTVTALYEIVPAGKQVDMPPVDDLKYQKTTAAADKTEDKDADASTELLTLKMRYKAPDGDTSKKLEWPVTDGGQKFADATDDFQFATAVAGFGLLLRDSQYKGNLTFAADLELAQSGLDEDAQGYRAEFLEMVRTARKLKGE